MAKRFVETQRWQDEWFCNLGAEEKLLFIYLCDKCDNAGFWQVNYKLASFETGIKPNRIVRVSQGLAKGYLTDNKELFIKNFIYHQGNLPLNLKVPAHKGIYNILKRKARETQLGSDAMEYINSQVLAKGYVTLTQGLANPQGQGKGQGKGIYVTKPYSNNNDLTYTKEKSLESSDTLRGDEPKDRAIEIEGLRKNQQFKLSLDSVLYCKNNSDRTCRDKVTAWLGLAIEEKKYTTEIYARVLDWAKEAAKNGRKPWAHFLNILNRELNYVPQEVGKLK